MSNPKLAVEFAAIGYQETIRQIDSLAAKGNSHLAQWENHTKTAAEKIHESYQRLFDRAIALEDRKTREMFQMSRARLAQEERAARQRERAEASASRAIIAQKKAETAELIAEGKRALAAQEAQAKERARVVVSAQRQTQLAMESRVANAGGYGPKLSTTQYGPSIDLKRAHDFQIAEEKRLTRELERENLQRERGESAHPREMARIAKTNRAQLNLENKVANAGGYGPHLPTPTVAPDRMATALNAGIVNAAAFLNVATSAYYMASKAVAVVGSFVLDAAKWEAMTLALENMEGGAENAAGAIARLYEIAKAPAIDLETAQHAYLKLRAVSIQGSEAERIIKAFSNTVARGGGSSVQFGRVLEQFTQMRAENRVLQQDLKFMKNSMPELASLMQKAFGTTTAEGIRKLGLNAREFTEKILIEMEKLPKAQQTLTSEIENMTVAWSRMKAAMVDTNFTKRVLQDFTSTFEEITKILNAKSINWKRLIMGVLGGHGAEYGAYAGGREKDFAEVNVFFDKIEAKATITGVKEKAGKNYRATDSRGKTRTDWLTFVQEKWDKADAATTPPVVEPDSKGGSEKKKYDPIAEARKRLAEQMRLRQMAVDAEKAYNDNMAKMLSEGVDEREATIVAEGIKAVAAKKKEYEALEKDAHGDAKLLTEIEKQKNEAVRAVRVKYNADRNAMSEKIRKEDETREAQDRIKAVQSEIDKAEARKKTILENEKNLQAEIDKYTAGEALSAETNQLLAIENEYKLHYERIKNAKFESEAEKARVTEEFQNKEKAAIRDFYAQQYSIAVSGASDMFGALAELRKNGTSEANDTYQVLFGISKAFAIADATIKLSSAAINAMTVGSSQGIPTMIANIGTTMAMGGALISQITATAYSGVFDKGGTIPVGKWGIAGENGPEIIQGPAHVTSTRDTARLMGSGSGTKVVVNNYSGASVSTKTNGAGEMEILIQRAAEVAEDRISAGIASGGGKVSQQLTRTFGVKR